WRRKIEELQLLGTRPAPSQNEITLYPNPSSGQIHVRLDSFTPGNATIIIRDLQGNLIEENMCLFDGHVEISTQSLPSGLYLLTLINANTLYTGKFVMAR
ncbi:MAG TPA: T9SS type A sorting domain-containing protein, partial [Saprospiraceae bacterium]|nr:T9SS type A sorting domain-containing protein [Saprospiraceae bacterium]